MANLNNALMHVPGGNALLHQVTFAGENAQTADRQALERARGMAAGGADPNDIWRETGWFQAPDGRWRYEINDRDAGEFNDRDAGEWGPRGRPQPSEVSAFLFESIGRVRGSRQPQVSQLRELFRHNELFRAYSALGDMNVQIVPRNYLTNERAAAQYSPTLRVLRINADDTTNDDGPAAHRNILHELQHAIQHTEDFAYGRVPGTGGFGGISDYMRRPGEGEARLVEERAGWPADQQRRTAPWADPVNPDDRTSPELDYTDPERYDWAGALTYRELVEKFRHQQPDVGTALNPRPLR